MYPKVLVAASIKPIMLSVLSHGESYGYQIVQRIHALSDGRLVWTDGTLYPVLHTLETDGLLASSWRMSESGRKRKYYKLTEKGRQALVTEKRQWMDIHTILIKLWEPGLATA